MSSTERARLIRWRVHVRQLRRMMDRPFLEGEGSEFVFADRSDRTCAADFSRWASRGRMRQGARWIPLVSNGA